MENKNLIYIVGGVAVLGIAYYMYKKRQATPKASTTPVAETKSEDDTEDVVAKPKMASSTATNPLQGKPANPMATEMASTPPASTPPASTPPASTPKTKLTKVEVEFRLLKKCGKKPLLNIRNSVQKYENCKNRLKDDLRGQGLISFSGERPKDDLRRRSSTSFDGMDDFSNMSNDFDISFR